MEKTELRLVDGGVGVDVPHDYRTPSLRLDRVSSAPLTLDLSSWAVPQAGPQEQPTIDAGDGADWWNAPTYTTDLIPPFRGVVTVTASSGDAPTRPENGTLARLSLNMGDPLALIDGGASAGLTSLPGAYPRGEVQVTETKKD